MVTYFILDILPPSELTALILVVSVHRQFDRRRNCPGPVPSALRCPAARRTTPSRTSAKDAHAHQKWAGPALMGWLQRYFVVRIRRDFRRFHGPAENADESAERQPHGGVGEIRRANEFFRQIADCSRRRRCAAAALRWHAARRAAPGRRHAPGGFPANAASHSPAAVQLAVPTHHS